MCKYVMRLPRFSGKDLAAFLKVDFLRERADSHQFLLKL